MREFLAIAKALGDESRLRALLSVKDGELCLCQIIDVLGLSPATVSKHMNVLYRAGLVDRRKDGKWHFYRLAGGEENGRARRTLDWVVAELANDPAVRDDERRIRAVRRRNLEELSACYRS
jgi:DNA-binding transcriptional ArsR family regulator